MLNHAIKIRGILACPVARNGHWPVQLNTGLDNHENTFILDVPIPGQDAY